MEEEWIARGWFGPAAEVAEAKAAVEALPLERVGIVVPPRGEPPAAMDATGEVMAFAAALRADDEAPPCAGLREARPDIVHRLLWW